MAARKNATLKAFKTPKALATKLPEGSKVTKPSSGRYSARHVGGKAWSTVQLKNGLLSMEKTPPHLVKVVKRNATKSPLLRLPQEIRNMIWDYAMTGNIVSIQEDADETRVDAETWDKVLTIYKGQAVGVMGEDTPEEWLRIPYRKRSHIHTAFHLPETCRQIYAETATLAYTRTIFLLDDSADRFRLVREWNSSLIPAHKEAIADISMSATSLEPYFTVSQDFIFRKFFPGLRRIHMSENDLDWLRIFLEIEPLVDMESTVEDFQEWMQETVSEREGYGVKLVFYKASKDERIDIDAAPSVYDNTA
ncbi:beta transducin [Kalmusia sp. IMI 367209]|nr:beta transducin [Kalmusia sp. IMI 367209]